MEDKIKALLDDLRPLLNADGGDLEFIKYEDNFVYIKLTGACAMCGYQDDTITFGLERYIKDALPEVEGVINVPI